MSASVAMRTDNALGAGCQLHFPIRGRIATIAACRMGRKIFRLLLALACAVAIGLAWLVCARPISMLLDRFHRTEMSSRPITGLQIDGDMLRIGDTPFELKGDQLSLRSSIDDGGRWTAHDSGNRITVGEKAGSLGEVGPAPGETAQFQIDRSVLSWPTPLEFNFMTGVSPSWKRHLYYRLIWCRPSGEKLELTWRYEQWFYPGIGWTSGFMTRAGTTGLVRVTISP